MAKGNRNLRKKPFSSKRKISRTKPKMRNAMKSIKWSKSKNLKFDENNAGEESSPSQLLGEASGKAIEEKLVDDIPQSDHSENVSSQNELYSEIRTNLDWKSGRRIMDVNHFFSSLKKFAHNDLFSCSNNDVQIMNEVQYGFRSKYLLKCDICSNESIIWNEDVKDESKLDINKGLVIATISTGGGFSQMQEFFSMINIPCMNNHTFLKNQEIIATHVHEAAIKLIDEAGNEERNLAIEAGDIDPDGIPYITVIADGAWSKRSYKVNYDAASGVGVIVGKRTGKVLYISVRNKVCCICTRSNNKNVDIPIHKCFKNWEGASTAMEADIIVEGFKESINMHGLKYIYLIGDGDSSITKKLLEHRPYGSRLVNKIECKNHLLRNFCTRLRQLTQQRISTQLKPVPIRQRNKLKNSVKRLRNAVQCAVKYHISSTENHEDKIKNVRKDIINSIHFWETKMQSKLATFYDKCILPEIINPQHPYGRSIKDLRE